MATLRADENFTPEKNGGSDVSNRRELPQTEIDASIAECRNGLRERILKLSTADQADVAHILSLDDQTETLRRNGTWARLGDVLEAHGYEETGEKLRELLWRRIKDSPFKRFQELFCLPEDRIVPMWVLTGGKPGNLRLDSLSVHDSLVRPDFIADDLAESLKLCTFELKEKIGSKLAKKHSAIDRLKLLFEASKPIEQGNYRILVIHPPERALTSVYLDVPAPDASLHGAILYSRETYEPHGPEKESRKRLTVGFYENAYGAIRKTEHQNLQYAEEIATLVELRSAISAYNGRLNREWTRDASPNDKKHLRVETQAFLTRKAEELDGKNATLKQAVQCFLRSALAITDKSEKPNVTTVMSKLVAAMNRLAWRLREDGAIGSYNTRDAYALETAMQSGETTMKNFRNGILRNGAVVGTQNIALFGKERMSPAQVDSNVRGMFTRIGVHPDDLAGITLAPLCGYARRITEQWQVLREALQRRNLNAAKRAVTAMHVLGKFQAAETFVERMKGFLLKQDIPLSDIRDYSKRIEDILSGRELFPDVNIQELDLPYATLLGKLTDLQTMLRPIISGTEQPSAESIEALRDALGATNVRAILSA